MIRPGLPILKRVARNPFKKGGGGCRGEGQERTRKGQLPRSYHGGHVGAKSEGTMGGGEEIKRTRARGMQGDRRRRIVPETRSSSPALTPVGVQVTREGPPWNRSLASSTPPVCPAAFLKPGDPAPTRAAATRGGTQSGGSRKSRDEKSN